jgi:hypothetical protein
MLWRGAIRSLKDAEFASTELYITLSTRAVAHAFEVGHSAMKRSQLRGYDNPPAEDDIMKLPQMQSNSS